jgi:putative endonuclease
VADPRHRFGQEAEQRVAAALTARGWRVLARRFRVAEGELDLVCLDPVGTIVGMEVRARRSPRAGLAIESVRGGRIRRLRAALGRYLSGEVPAHRDIRIDLVTLDRTPRGWIMVRHPTIDGW